MIPFRPNTKYTEHNDHCWHQNFHSSPITPVHKINYSAISTRGSRKRHTTREGHCAVRQPLVHHTKHLVETSKTPSTWWVPPHPAPFTQQLSSHIITSNNTFQVHKSQTFNSSSTHQNTYLPIKTQYNTTPQQDFLLVLYTDCLSSLPSFPLL